MSPQWSMLEEIEFHRLAKLCLEVDEPKELYVQIQKLNKSMFNLLVQGFIRTSFPI